MTRHEILKGLGFILELSRKGESSLGPWERWRHHTAPDNSDFALIIYESCNQASFFTDIQAMLLKVGRYAKAKQLKQVLNIEDDQ